MSVQIVNYETVWGMVKKLPSIQKRRMLNDLDRSLAIEDDSEDDEAKLPSNNMTYEEIAKLKKEYVVEGGLSEAIYEFWAALPPQTSEITDEELEDMRYEALMERHLL